MRKTPLIIIGTLVLIVLFLVLCTFVQRPYEDVIVNRFGTIVEPTTLVRGWKLCLPTDRLIRIDHRAHLYTSDLIETNTQESRPVSVRTFAAWRIVDARTFYLRQETDEQAARFLDKLMTGMVAKKFAEYPLDRIFNEKQSEIVTDQIEAKILADANVQLKAEGMKLEQVGFSRMAFPPKIAQSVYSRMVADRKVAADDQRNAGQAKATQIVAEGDLESRRIQTEAKAEASTLQGKGDQAAIEILGAVTKTTEAREWYRIFKGMELVKATLTKNTYVILPDDSPIVNGLFNVVGKMPQPDPPPRGRRDRQAAASDRGKVTCSEIARHTARVKP